MKKKINQKDKIKLVSDDGQKGIERRFFYFFFLLLVLSQIHENLTVEIRQDKHEKCFTRRGLRVGTKNKGFHREFM